MVPKAYLPNYREFYERRHFTPGAGIHGRRIEVAGREAPFGADLLFRSSGSVDLSRIVANGASVRYLLSTSDQAMPSIAAPLGA